MLTPISEICLQDRKSVFLSTHIDYLTLSLPVMDNDQINKNIDFLFREIMDDDYEIFAKPFSRGIEYYEYTGRSIKGSTFMYSLPSQLNEGVFRCHLPGKLLSSLPISRSPLPCRKASNGAVRRR